jgi:hypothetical protein
MTLRFEPDRVVYDPSEGLLRVFATDGVLLVRCAVSKAALAALEDDALGGLASLISTYRRNRKHIQAIAQRKYQRREFESGGNVVIRLDDVHVRTSANAAARSKAIARKGAGALLPARAAAAFPSALARPSAASIDRGPRAVTRYQGAIPAPASSAPSGSAPAPRR